MADVLDEIVDEASSTTASGAYKALTPLQRRANTLRPLPAKFTDNVVNTTPMGTGGMRPSQLDKQVEDAASGIGTMHEQQTSGLFKVMDAAGAAIEDSYPMRAYREATADTSSTYVDKTYDSGGQKRLDFINKYGESHLLDYDKTVNNVQATQLYEKLDADEARKTRMGGSLVGAVGGSLLDPTFWLEGGVAIKGAMLAKDAYKLGRVGTAATGAAIEGVGIGATEAGMQNYEFGHVYNKTKVGEMMAFSAAIHFGLGTTIARGMYEKTVKAITPEQALAEGMIGTAQKELAQHSESVARELAGGRNVVPEPVRDYPTSAYSEFKQAVDEAPEVAVEGAGVDAGAAFNKIHKGIQDNVIETPDELAEYWVQYYAVEHAARDAETLGPTFSKWLSSPVGKLSAKFSNTLQALSSKSDVLRAWATRLGEDGTGMARTVQYDTAIVKSKMNNVLRGHFADIHTEYQQWLKRNGTGGIVNFATGKGEAEWNRQLRHEMEVRWNTKDIDAAEMRQLDEARWADIDPEIKRAADAYDRGNQAALDFMQRHKVLGSENLSSVSRGYVQRRLSGDTLRNLASTDKAKYRQVTRTLGRRYFDSFKKAQDRAIAAINADTTLSPSLRATELAKIKPITQLKADTIAQGVIEKALNRSSGVEGTTIGVFDRAARDEIRTILQSKNMDYSDIEHTFSLLDKRLGKTTGSARLKGRMSVDLSTADDKTGIRLLDYFENDLNRLTTSYAEEMSGRVALARQGIRSDNDFEHIINAINKSHSGTAEEVKADIQLARDMYAQLLGRPLDSQGRNKVLHFLTQINPLQTLGQVGVAQATESSLSVARLGMGTMLKSLPLLAKVLVGARKNLLNESDTLLLKDIEAWNGPIGELWRTHRPSTDVMERLNSSGEVSRMADTLLKGAQHINGYVSMMHQMMETQLKVVAVAGTRSFAKDIQKGVLTPRIADAGFTQESMLALKKELDAHAVFKHGELHDLNLGKWSHDNAEHFTTNLERLSGQLIQKDFVGETASWMHKDLGRMLLSLRGYSVKAFNKQLVRNIKLHDAVAAQSLVFGMAFSTMGYTAKVHLLSIGREDQAQFLEDRLSGDALIQGAVGYMALGSFGPELVRPLASWNAEAGDAGAIKSGGNALVALIPGLSPLARLQEDITNIGSTAMSSERDFNAKKTRHLVQSTLGNSFPIAFAMNALTDDNN